MATVAVIADADTWIEGNAVQQLHTTAALPHMRHVAGMPDLHAGRGYPVGAAFLSSHHFYPALIGNDIGCGMAAVRTSLTLADLPDEALPPEVRKVDADAPGRRTGEEHVDILRRLMRDDT